MIRVERVVQLPLDIQTLREEADRDGIRNMGLLVEEWASGFERFDKPGEALFAAFDGGTLIGIGGVTIERDAPAMRMRRLYVLCDRRKQGAGRALAAAMMAQGFQSADLLTSNARPPGAAEFWDAMGFKRIAAPRWTHELRRC
ncbi:MAG TPA: GNAT family N-acetyltransferase [Rhizomicrobium sp.]